MEIAYIDCSSGASGDMLLGALIDGGVSIDYIKEHLKSLRLDNYQISSRTVNRAGIQAVKLDVRVKEEEKEARKWKDIERIISESNLKDRIKEKGLRIFKSLFLAESHVHGTSYDKTHLHELGAIDCIVDIIGFLIGIDYLGIEEITVSPINVGSGTTKTSHGILPIPAPATAELLKGIPVYSSGMAVELTTPTGAAILKEAATGFGTFPEMVIDTIGYGAGGKDLKGQPNVLRLFIGRPSHLQKDKLTVIETNIDDMSPQIYDHLMEKLLKSGANDVYLTPIIMKKGRPAIKLTVLVADGKRDILCNIIFNETTTIGIRHYEVSREKLKREIKTIQTEYGRVRVKIASRNNERLNVSPEYEDCKKIADKHSIPLKKVITDITKQLLE